MKDTLVVNGHNVVAPDIEWLAGEMNPGLNPLAAAAFEGNRSGSAVLLIEVKDKRSAIENIQALEKRIAANLRAEFAFDQVVVHVLERGVLERTTSGKIRR
ncbi:MAG: hypothetical protein QNJ43_06670 [Breoghania sp.]|nr:hypothetical protein [Breoghania sp.]